MLIQLENTLLELGATNIGGNALNGVYWFNYSKDNKIINDMVIKLSQYVIQSKITQKEIFTVKNARNYKYFIFNQNLYQDLLNKMLKNLYEKNPRFPKINGGLSLKEKKEKEINLFAQYISSIPKNKDEVDVYLYKLKGDRETSLYIQEGDKHYRKDLYGFYLVEEDIQQVNKKLAKFNRKIDVATQRDIQDPLDGIRYTLELGNANILNN